MELQSQEVRSKYIFKGMLAMFQKLAATTM